MRAPGQGWSLLHPQPATTLTRQKQQRPKKCAQPECGLVSHDGLDMHTSQHSKVIMTAVLGCLVQTSQSYFPLYSCALPVVLLHVNHNSVCLLVAVLSHKSCLLWAVVAAAVGKRVCRASSRGQQRPHVSSCVVSLQWLVVHYLVTQVPPPVAATSGPGTGCLLCLIGTGRTCRWQTPLLLSFKTAAGFVKK